MMRVRPRLVSVLQIQQPDFADRVLRILREEGFDACRFGIEVTESMPMHRLEEIAGPLRTLRACGVEISLDDFGTGYSSLSCLRRLPIDVVKIDRSLVPAVEAGSDALPIARAIIAMSHSLGMKVLAEGVENANQLEWLKDNRCDLFQGYHYSKPVDADGIAALVRAGRRRPAGSPCRAPAGAQDEGGGDDAAREGSAGLAETPRLRRVRHGGRRARG